MAATLPLFYALGISAFVNTGYDFPVSAIVRIFTVTGGPSKRDASVPWWQDCVIAARHGNSHGFTTMPYRGKPISKCYL
jgi:hypothetical protein